MASLGLTSSTAEASDQAPDLAGDIVFFARIELEEPQHGGLEWAVGDAGDQDQQDTAPTVVADRLAKVVTDVLHAREADSWERPR